MKKKVVALTLVVIIAVAAVGVWKSGILNQSTSTTDNSAEIYVTSLADIMGTNSSYSANVFMGVVEGQETSGVTKSSERELDDVYVSEGDSVTVGSPLFSYKTDSLEAENVQYGYDIEGYNLSIIECNNQIAKLQIEYDKITGDSDEDKTKKEELTNQINSLTTDIAINNNNIQKVNAQIEENNNKINNSIVKSTVDGVITKVADDTNPYTTDGTFITILASTEMQVKGQVNEQNVWAINVDEPVTLRSRIDDTQTWTGTITKIDTESKQESSDNSYGNSSDSNSTKYPFYVTLDDSEGLMMGQHLYIELGQAQTSDIDFSNGTYIYDYYIAYDEEGNPFVWVDQKGKLAKQTIELGDYYEDEMVYSVSGIDNDTMIAYPMEDYTEGMKTVSGYEGE